MSTVRLSVGTFITKQRNAIGIFVCVCIIVGIAWQLLNTTYYEYRFTNNHAFVGFWAPEQYASTQNQVDSQFRLSWSYQLYPISAAVE
jgi:hypothetical protein